MVEDDQNAQEELLEISPLLSYCGNDKKKVDSIRDEKVVERTMNSLHSQGKG